ncbi:MAG: DUF5591 domain-containing protein [Thermoplasmata archaeon]|nr:MAG: DUF5591 domain-containing protein [Thermoplasmata archaeon]
MADDRIKAPDEAEILISNKKISSQKPYLISTESLFSGKEYDITDYTISPSLTYPPSQDDLNSFASAINKEQFSSKVFVVTGKDDAIVNSVESVEAEVYILANVMHLIRRPKSLVHTLVTLRKSTGYQRLIYTPGLGSPHNMALLAYCGVDLFDSVPLILNARLGNYLTTQGKIHKDEIQEDFCFCPSCIKKEKDYDSLLLHNYYASLSELKIIRNAIHNGRLRELVESRMRSEPWMVSVLRILDIQYYSLVESNLPVTGGQFIAASNESLLRPEIVRFRKRLKDRYKKPPHKKVLLLLPCSAKKPYSFSRTHKIFRRVIAECGNRSVVHEVIITSPLGIVPRELELFYPAQHYDIPVTRMWSKDEIAMIGEGISEFLKINEYEDIVIHLPGDYAFIKDFISDCTITSFDSPTSSSSLEKLQKVLGEFVKPYEKVDRQTEQRERMMNFARFQFGEAGCALVEGVVIKGRYPNLKIQKDKEQLGMLVGERGLISLTLEGGKILAEQNAYWVKIHDFIPKGSIFAVGVEDSDKNIRIGDDVVVLREDELMGVGVAVMGPKEMVESNRGEAVKIRHLVKFDEEKS